MPSVAVGVDIFISPVLATAAATKATVPLAMSNDPAFCLPPSSYTKLSTVIFALAVRLKGGGVIEGDAQGGICRCLQHVVQKDVVLQFERRGSVVAGNRRAAGQRREISDRLVGCCLVRRGRSCRRRGGVGLRKALSSGPPAPPDRDRSH